MTIPSVTTLLAGLACAASCVSAPSSSTPTTSGPQTGAGSLAPAAPATTGALPSTGPATEGNKENHPAISAAAATTQTTAMSNSSAMKNPPPHGTTHSAQNQPSAEPAQARGELAMLRVEVMSLKEKVATLQRKFDIILKGQRSGLYDDVTLPTNLSAMQNPAQKKNPVPPLASEGPIDRFENDNDVAKRQSVLELEKPQQIVDKALMLLEQREFGRVAQVLENFQQRFPNNGLSAIAELTLAEAYVELKSAQQALTHVRTFYLQHPNDPQLIRAKWLEARSHEILGAPQRAAQLFREVIILNPQSQLALRARAALEKVSRGGAQ